MVLSHLLSTTHLRNKNVLNYFIPCHCYEFFIHGMYYNKTRTKGDDSNTIMLRKQLGLCSKCA